MSILIIYKGRAGGAEQTCDLFAGTNCKYPYSLI